MQKPATLGLLGPTTPLVMPVLNPCADVVNYLKKYCNLPADQIEKKLMTGETFDMIKGDGNDIDTKLLEQVLADNDFYEKPAQKNFKDETMRFLKNVVEQWSMDIAKNQMHINQDQIVSYTAKLLPFGSYVLDLRSNSSDIDLICVCPNFISRQTHFFGLLVQRLQREEEVKNLGTRANARVPIITFEYKEIDIDISFCQLTRETIPRDIEKVISNQLVASIADDQSKTSLLGRKNNLMIVELAGRQKENFKETLRVVKVWAKNRGISSNGLGYLGGISWAILVAKICQIFPNHKPAKLLVEFFLIYSIWNWKHMPVRIMPPGEEKFKESVMCVVTPGSDYNSTQRVNAITFRAICEEIVRASNLLSLRTDYSETCRKLDFFSAFPLFLEIDVCGKEGESDFKQFQSLVESRVLKLLQIILRYYKKQIDEGNFKVVPNPKLYKKSNPNYLYCSALFIGLNYSPQTNISLLRTVKEWASSIDQSRPNKNLNVHIFEATPADFAEVEIVEPKKKKEEKEDPRLLMRRAKNPQE